MSVVGCRKRGVVLDPYVGSGTTLVAAAKRKLPSIGFELIRAIGRRPVRG